MAEYLGKVTGLITGTELSNLCGFTSGELILTSDITWLKFSEDNKVFLVSSSCIRKKISYNDISEISCVFGKDIVINDKKYKCRLLTGANDSKDGPGGEWDRCIVTHVPQNEDSGWQGLYNICQEIINNKTVMRGYNAVDSFHNVVSADTWNQGYGWKPVLEFYPLCKNSISSQDLGDKYFLEDINYIITGDTHTLTEKLDEISIRTLENQVSGTEYTLDLSAQWDSLAYGKHTIETIATDSNGLSSTVTITFNKIRELTKPISTESSLKEFIDHISNIDKDIDYLKFKLSDNLREKDVECSDTDKMSNLIDKVSNIHLGKKWASGTCSSDSSTYSPQVLGNTVNVQCAKLEIPNLDFVPSFIFAKNESDSVNDYSLYYKNTSEYFSYGRQNRLNTGNLGSWIIKPGDIFRVDSDSIVIPVQNVNKTFDWVAFE